MLNEIEVGISDSGLRPKLVQRFGGLIKGVTMPARPMTDVLMRRLHRMDGAEFGTLLIAVQHGEPKYVGDFDTAALGEYIQSAGSADAMTVEIRRPESDGVFRQYAVGRDVDEPGTRTVLWAPGSSETVPANEVFTADQAHPVYLQWCWDQTVPDGYRLRLLNI